MPESETDFDGRTLHYVHDAGGRLVTRINAAGQAVRMEYDVLDNRILKEADGEALATSTTTPAGSQRSPGPRAP
ncbi:hypothetical protein [Streptomyces sp. NPDC057686]|uniref:hypothetical protein n=1 Tax=Streptomyces sp. NPDC057686 TaxID=3346212 RepID=UPI0036C52C8B